eukprot:6320190-Prymnesium_polylepis.1
MAESTFGIEKNKNQGRTAVLKASRGAFGTCGPTGTCGGGTCGGSTCGGSPCGGNTSGAGDSRSGVTMASSNPLLSKSAAP